MKYLHQEYVLSTLRDEEVKSEEEIRDIFTNCLENKFDASIDFKMSGVHPVHYDRIRVSKVYEKSVDFTVFKKKENYKMKKVFFFNIDKIAIVNYPSSGFKIKEDSTRADLMDLS